jgi:hypothetical protein
MALHREVLDPSAVDETLGLLLKNQEDIEAVRGERTRVLLERALARGTRQA